VFWEKAYEIARQYGTPAEDQRLIIEMTRAGKAVDHKQISLDEYRYFHRLAMAKFEQNKQRARQEAALIWSQAFQQMGQNQQEMAKIYGKQHRLA
jgi:hypothetical protein